MMKFSKFRNNNNKKHQHMRNISLTKNISYWTMKLFYSGIFQLFLDGTFVTLHILHVLLTLRSEHCTQKFPIQWKCCFLHHFYFLFWFTSCSASSNLYISTTNDTEHNFHLTWSHSCERTKVLCVLQNSCTLHSALTIQSTIELLNLWLFLVVYQ